MSEEAPSPVPVSEQTDKLYDSIIKLIKERQKPVTIQEIHNEIKPYSSYQQTYYAVQGIISTGLLVKDHRKVDIGYSYNWLPEWLHTENYEKWVQSLNAADITVIKEKPKDKREVREGLLRFLL